MLAKLKFWAKWIKRDVVAVWLAGRDPRVPWYVKALALGVAAYALSPIDLIPDFIPILGQLDDLILIPLGVTLAVKLVPPALWAEMQQRAEAFRGKLPKMVWGLLLVALIWAALLALFVWALVSAVVRA